MKIIKKERFAILLAVIFVFMSVFNNVTYAEAKTVSEVKQQIDSIKANSAGFIPGATSKYPSNCYSFVNDLTNQLFGHGLPPQNGADNYRSFTSAYTTNFNQVGTTLRVSDGTLTVDNLRNLFMQAQAGDVVQCKYDWKDDRHVLMVYSTSSTGVVFYHSGGNVYFGKGGSGNQSIWGTSGRELSYEDLKTYYFSNSTSGLSVYRSKKVDGAPTITEPPTVAPTITLTAGTYSSAKEGVYPTALAVGSNFGLRGTVTTDYGYLEVVWGAIFDFNGNIRQEVAAYGNAGTKSINIQYSDINNKLVFGTLPEGWYRYYVSACAYNGSLKTDVPVIDHWFKVGNPTCGHHWNDGQVTTQPTGNTAGVKTYTCIVCGQTRTEAIPMTDTSAPVVQNVYITELWHGGYLVHAKVSDNVGTVNVKFPTWSDKNGQDDLIWHDGYYDVTNDEWIYKVDYSEHNYDGGYYCTHVYGYDAAGNGTPRESAGVLKIQLPTLENSINGNTNSQNNMVIRCKDGRVVTRNSDNTLSVATYTGAPNQLWNFTHVTGTVWRISGKMANGTTGYLEINTVASDRIRLTTSTTYINLGLEKLDGYYMIKLDQQFKWCVDIWGGLSGKDLYTAWGHGGDNQLFTIENHQCAYDSGTVTKQPTCSETGSKKFTCTICGATKTETLAKVSTAHTWNSGSITTKPTCSKTGVKTYTCSGCKTTKTETVAKDSTAHTWNSGSITKAATCTATGVKTYTCTGCSTTKTETVAIDANNHSWNSGTIVKEPTYTAEGVKRYTCTRCNKTKDEAIPVVDNNLVFHAGSSISLDGNISYTYWIKMSDALINNKHPYVRFSVGGEVSDCSTYNVKTTSSGKYYGYTVNVNAAQMTEIIYVSVMSDSGLCLSDTVTVADYAKVILDNKSNSSEYASAKDIVVAMLNYGGYAQEYFGVNTNKLANAGLFTTSALDPVANKAQFISAVSDFNGLGTVPSNSELTYIGASLVCENVTEMKFYFKSNDSTLNGSLQDKYKVTTNVHVASIYANDGIVVVTINGIYADQLDDQIFVNITSKNNSMSPITFMVSPVDYIVTANRGGTMNTKLENLTRAMYYYNKAAKEYAA